MTINNKIEKKVLIRGNIYFSYENHISGNPALHEKKSDVKAVEDSHPAVIEIDFSGFSGRSAEAIQQYKEQVKGNI